MKVFIKGEPKELEFKQIAHDFNVVSLKNERGIVVDEAYLGDRECGELISNIWRNNGDMSTLELA